MAIFENVPLVASIIAILFAQFVKVPIRLMVSRKIEWGLMFSTGGMPSSHSAAVTALMTTLAIEHGFGSPYFAVAVVFGIIVMFDATGVRRQAGEQAVVLNKLVSDFQDFVEHAKGLTAPEQEVKQKHLKELLGHKPMEVFFGAVTGISIGLIISWIMGAF
ncbi:putative membrane protein yuiD [Listeria floridensis FSL S10-1187]|uniref:Membrane protein yuiD n=1 Tax=Listeria floridensis FSL S10-1187 TaxID=1265817 RepID=A0ABN0RFU1_9LIST|nr:divergent PAP2 family protein [Listeria floridensis]EUJ32414.1 putative membrane protein yuiD [Listeria floridensis FSL S10-1187]